jgi:hypothetical protein
MNRVVGILATALALAAAAPAAAGRPGVSTTALQAATASGNQYTQTAGTFTVTGPWTDAGTLRMSYRFANARIDATATLIGARGIFTLSLRGVSGAIVVGHPTVRGPFIGPLYRGSALGHAGSQPRRSARC